MKKSIFLFAISMLFIVVMKAQTAPAPKPKPTPVPAATTKPADSRNGGVQAPAQTPATRPAQNPGSTPSTAPATKGSNVSKANTRPKAVKMAPTAKRAPASARQSQKIQK